MVLEARLSTLIAFFESPYKRLLKAEFFYTYKGKTYIECYNFFQ